MNESINQVSQSVNQSSTRLAKKSIHPQQSVKHLDSALTLTVNRHITIITSGWEPFSNFNYFVSVKKNKKNNDV